MSYRGLPIAHQVPIAVMKSCPSFTGGSARFHIHYDYLAAVAALPLFELDEPGIHTNKTTTLRKDCVEETVTYFNSSVFSLFIFNGTKDCLPFSSRRSKTKITFTLTCHSKEEEQNDTTLSLPPVGNTKGDRRKIPSIYTL